MKDSASKPDPVISVPREFPTRSRFLLKLALAGGSEFDGELSPDQFRAALQILSQDTRFSIFSLICERPGELTLEDICLRLGGPREKFYHHLYQMLRVNLIVVSHDVNGTKYFKPGKKFVTFGARYFDEVIRSDSSTKSTGHKFDDS